MTESLRITEEDEILIFPDDGSKPTVGGDKEYKFFPGDDVVIVDPRTQPKEGPYVIEKAENGRYTLCDEQGKSVKVGEWFEESRLEAYDPFA